MTLGEAANSTSIPSARFCGVQNFRVPAPLRSYRRGGEMVQLLSLHCIRGWQEM
jgi:hypothetical protein